MQEQSFSGFEQSFSHSQPINGSSGMITPLPAMFDDMYVKSVGGGLNNTTKYIIN